MQDDLWKMFAEFHQNDIKNTHTNANSIVSIPKKCYTRRMADFRPVNLVTSLYKAIAKVLAKRLRSILNDTILYT